MIKCQRDEKSIFNVARIIASPDVRADYLQQVCGHNSALLDRVATLLHAFETEPSFLESPLLAVDPTIVLTPLTERLCTNIGRYLPLQEISEDGMGVVSLAVRHSRQKGIIHRSIKPLNVMIVRHSQADALVQKSSEANELSAADNGFFVAMSHHGLGYIEGGEAVARQGRGVDRKNPRRGRPRHRGPSLEPAADAQTVA